MQTFALNSVKLIKQVFARKSLNISLIISNKRMSAITCTFVLINGRGVYVLNAFPPEAKSERRRFSFGVLVIYSIGKNFKKSI